MIYISGPITKNKNFKKDFTEAENHLRRTRFDFIKNPLHIYENLTERIPCPTYEQILIEDINNLVYCDKIYLLRGWWKSKGARLERRIAKTLKMDIIYQKKRKVKCLV